MARGGASSRGVAQRAVAAILVQFAFCISTDVARAAPTIESIRVGFSEVYHPDRWCPVDVRVANVETDGHYRIDIDAVDNAGRRICHTTMHRLNAGRVNQRAQLIQLGRRAERIAVTLRNADGQVIAKREFDRAQIARPLAEDESLVLVVGRLSGLDRVDALRSDAHRRTRFQQIAGLSQLPSAEGLSPVDRSLSLDGLATVVWMVGQSSAAADIVDADGSQLLGDWVRTGGRLIISLGPNAARVLPGSTLATSLNLGTLAERTELRQPAPLEAFIGSENPASPSRSRTGDEEQPFHVDVLRLGPVEGNIAAAVSQTDGNLPLIVHVPHGFGEVVIVAFDLSDKSLDAWPGHARMLSKVLALGDVDAPRDVVGQQANRVWTGKKYSSMSEQLADALDRFPGASPERFWDLAAAAIGYILIIGPIDWYLVRRRPEWTWATFLATVCLAAAGAYAIVHATKTNDVLVNQLRFIDVDLTFDRAAHARGTSWTSLYQPAAGVVNLTIEAPNVWPPSTKSPRDDATEFLVSPRSPRLSLWSRSSAGDSQPSLFSSHDSDREPAAIYDAAVGRIAELSTSAWSSQHFAARSLSATEPLPVATLAADAFGRVAGSVHNPFDEPLEQSVLFYGAHALALGTLPPGQTVAIDGRGDWRSAEAYLTRRTLTQDRETAEKYDATSVDLNRIGEIVGFYQTAGGEHYTGLDNRETANLDLSGQLRLGRAILMGRTAGGPKVELSPAIPASPHRQTTFWRFLLRPAGTLEVGK